MDARAALEERLRLIVRAIAGRPDLEVTTEAPPEIRASFAAEGKDVDEAWFTFRELDPNGAREAPRGARVRRLFVHLPPALLDVPEPIAKGKAAHEAGHVAISRNAEIVPDQVLARPGFRALLAAVEERPTDRVVAVRYPGAFTWLREARLDSLNEGRADDDATEDLGAAVHPFAQLCNLIVYSPYGDPGARSPVARDVYARIDADLRALEAVLPPDGASEELVRQAAIDRYRILHTRIWPVVARAFAGSLESAGDRALERLEETIARRFDGGWDTSRPPLRSELGEVGAALPLEVASRADAPPIASSPTCSPSVLRDVARHDAVDGAALAIYQRAYDAVRARELELYARLDELFRPDRQRRLRPRAVGSTLDLRAAFRWEGGRAAGARAIDPRIFERRERPERRDHAFTLLVDLSGSMSGEGKIEETFAATVLVAEVLARLEVRLEILGFQDDLLVFKPFEARLDDRVRGRLAGMLAETRGDNPGGHNESGYNDDGPCLLAAVASLARQAATERFLIVFSDGMPAGRSSDADDLREAVRATMAAGAVSLVGIGVGPGTEHVSDFYPVSIACVATDQLASELAALIDSILRAPRAFHV